MVEPPASDLVHLLGIQEAFTKDLDKITFSGRLYVSTI